MNIPRILIAAPSSGSGKTVISCGLMAAFCRQQKNVVSCKCGPDYIDPMFHREVLGIDSHHYWDILRIWICFSARKSS